MLVTQKHLANSKHITYQNMLLTTSTICKFMLKFEINMVNSINSNNKIRLQSEKQKTRINSGSQRHCSFNGYVLPFQVDTQPRPVLACR